MKLSTYPAAKMLRTVPISRLNLVRLAKYLPRMSCGTKSLIHELNAAFEIAPNKLNIITKIVKAISLESPKIKGVNARKSKAIREIVDAHTLIIFRIRNFSISPVTNICERLARNGIAAIIPIRKFVAPKDNAKAIKNAPVAKLPMLCENIPSSKRYLKPVFISLSFNIF